MSLGNLTLTDVGPEQEATFPGMAYFAGTGPAARFCGDCLNWDTKSRPIKGRCFAYRRLMGRAGPRGPADGQGVQIFRRYLDRGGAFCR